MSTIEEFMCEEIDIETLFAGVRIDSSAVKSIFDNLDEATQNTILVHQQYLVSLEGVLKLSSFVPAGARRLLKTLAEAENIVSFEELFLSISEKRYIVKHEREEALRLLMKWKPLILNEGKKIENEFFLRSGELTTEFTYWARTHGFRCHKYKGRLSDYVITGQMSPEEFESEISRAMSPSWQSHGIRYEVSPPWVDEKVVLQQ